MKNSRRFLFIIYLFTCVFTTWSQENANEYHKAINQVLGLYKDKQVVALGEIHARQKESDFRLALIRSPEFAKLVDIIIVEFANPLYQQIIDDYLSGEEVKEDDLKKIWRNTTQVSGVWDSPVYEEFFLVVRQTNALLKADDQIRVIAADPPIDWDKVHSFEDFKPFSERGSYPIGVIEEEVYKQGLNALLIFGTVHTERWGIGFTMELESKHPGTIAVIMPPPRNEAEMSYLQKSIELSNQPQLINLLTSKLGEVTYEDFHSDNRFKWKLKKAGEYMLFLGFEKDKVMEVPPSVKADTIYQNERKRRFKKLIREKK